MKTNHDSVSLLKERLLSDNTAIIRAMDTSQVTFDGQYYRKRRRCIRLYKRDLLTDMPEKILFFSFSCLISILLLAHIFVAPLIPILCATIVIIKLEERRYNEADRFPVNIPK